MQRVKPVAGPSGNRNDRDAQAQGQFLVIDTNALFGRGIGHVHDDQDREPNFERLANNEQGSLHLPGIHDDHHRAGRAPFGQLASQELARNPFFWRSGIERIETGQIDQCDGPILQRNGGGADFDRRPRKVGCLRQQVRQPIEKRCLADVGIADQRNARGRDRRPIRIWNSSGRHGGVHGARVRS